MKWLDRLRKTKTGKVRVPKGVGWKKSSHKNMPWFRKLKFRKVRVPKDVGWKKPSHKNMSFNELLGSLDSALTYRGRGQLKNRLLKSCFEIRKAIERIERQNFDRETQVSVVSAFREALFGIDLARLDPDSRKVVRDNLAVVNSMAKGLGIARGKKPRNVLEAELFVQEYAAVVGKTPELCDEMQSLAGLALREARRAFIRDSSSMEFRRPLTYTADFLERLLGSGEPGINERTRIVIEKELYLLKEVLNPEQMQTAVDSIRRAEGLVRNAKELSNLREAEAIARRLRSDSLIDNPLMEKVISNIERKRTEISDRLMGRTEKH